MPTLEDDLMRIAGVTDGDEPAVDPAEGSPPESAPPDPDPDPDPQAAAQSATGDEPPRRREPQDYVKERFHRRQSRERVLEQRLEALQDELAKVNSRLEASAKPAGPVDPEPDFDLEPKEWYLWQQRQQAEQQRPVIDFIRQQREQAEQQEAFRLQQAQRQQALGELAGAMQDFQARYEATEEGNGFNDRFSQLSRRLFAHHQQFSQDDQTASARTVLQLDGMIRDAIQGGYNPAEYLDSYARSLGISSNGHAVPPASPAQPQQRRPARPRSPSETGLGGSLGDTQPPPVGPVVSGGSEDVVKQARGMMRNGMTYDEVIDQVVTGPKRR